MRVSEHLMLQDVWRKAWREGSFEIAFQTSAGAHRARMALYNAVKEFKAGKRMDDLELSKAAESMEIVWADSAKTVIRLQTRDASDMLQSLQTALGKSVDEYVDPEAKASADRLLRELDGLGSAQAPAPVEPVATPAPTPAPAPAVAEPQTLSGHQNTPFYGKRG